MVACVEGLCRPLKRAGVDTVILGCTHYPLVRPVLQRALYRFLASGDPEEFRSLGTRFLQLPIAAVEHVEVDGQERRAA